MILKIRDNEGNIIEIPSFKGENGKSPIVKNDTWWTYDDNIKDYVDTSIGATKESIVTKEAVESVLTGTITSHDHDGVYLKDAPSDSKQYVRYNNEWVSIDLSSTKPYNVDWIDSETVTSEQIAELEQAIKDERLITYRYAVAVYIDSNNNDIVLEFIQGFEVYIVNIDKSTNTITIINRYLASNLELYSIIPKRIDHIPTESDIEYVYNEENYSYVVGTLVYYDNKIYQLYSITSNKADWREVVSKKNLDEVSNSIAVKNVNEELKTALTTLFNTQSGSILDDTTYNYLSNNLVSGTYGLDGVIFKVTTSNYSIDITVDNYSDSGKYKQIESISVSNDKTVTISGLTQLFYGVNAENIKAIVLGSSTDDSAFNSLTLLLSGDGTKYLNDKGEYTTIDSGIKKITDEELNLIESLENNKTLTDEEYSIITKLVSRGKSFYIEYTDDRALCLVLVYEDNEKINIVLSYIVDNTSIDKLIFVINKTTKVVKVLIHSSNTQCNTVSGGIYIRTFLCDGDEAFDGAITLQTTGDGTNVLSDSGAYIPALTESQVDTKINQAIASVYKVKGSVANYEALPTEASIGDVYNLLDTGANYACISLDPITWDKLSETVDLSAYSTTEENDAKYQPIGTYASTDVATTDTNGLMSSTDKTTVNNLAKDFVNDILIGDKTSTNIDLKINKLNPSTAGTAYTSVSLPAASNSTAGLMTADMYTMLNTAYSTANSAASQASSASSTANSASTKATEASNDASSALSQAISALSTANDAYGQADSAYDLASSNASDITAINNYLTESTTASTSDSYIDASSGKIYIPLTTKGTELVYIDITAESSTSSWVISELLGSMANTNITMIIHNSLESSQTVGITGTYTYLIVLGNTSFTIPTGGYMELSAVKFSNVNKYFVRGVV